MKVERGVGVVWEGGERVREGRGFEGLDKGWWMRWEERREEVGWVRRGGRDGGVVMVEVKG